SPPSAGSVRSGRAGRPGPATLTCAPETEPAPSDAVGCEETVDTDTDAPEPGPAAPVRPFASTSTAARPDVTHAPAAPPDPLADVEPATPACDVAASRETSARSRAGASLPSRASVCWIRATSPFDPVPGAVPVAPACRCTPAVTRPGPSFVRAR